MADDFRMIRTIPSLVYSCQRVLAANIDSISSFGPDIPHRLIRPILQGCNADTLLRLERETPHLQEQTSELWKEICVRSYPLVDQKLNPSYEVPQSWREEFFRIKGEQDRRFEEAASRIRNQRIEAEEMKRKRQVQLTDRLPPPKRPRSSGQATSKTLFQKTRKEATKIQKSVFGPRMLPTSGPGNSSGFRAKVDEPNTKLLQKGGNLIQVNTITVRASGALPSKPSPLLSKSTSKTEATAKSSECKARTEGEASKYPQTAMQYGIPRKRLSGPLPQKSHTSALLLPKQRKPSQLQSG